MDFNVNLSSSSGINFVLSVLYLASSAAMILETVRFLIRQTHYCQDLLPFENILPATCHIVSFEKIRLARWLDSSLKKIFKLLNYFVEGFRAFTVKRVVYFNAFFSDIIQQNTYLSLVF